MIERTQEDKERFAADMNRIRSKLERHSLGPWNNPGGVSVFDSKDKKVCDTQWLNRSVSEAKSNARLIAAAPELLEACKIALPLVHGYLISMGGTHAEQIMSQIESAIAKAEGK